MALRHGSVAKYNAGCRCEACREANSAYRRQKLTNDTAEDITADQGPGAVELAVIDEIKFAAEARPGLAAVAVALARVLDNPRATASKPAAAKVVATILDKLQQAGAPGRLGHLSTVRTMTTSSPSA